MSWVRLDVLLWVVAIVTVAWALPRRSQLPAVSALTFSFLVVNAPVSAALLVVFGLGSFASLARKAHSTRRMVAVVAIIVATWACFKIGTGSPFEDEIHNTAVPLGLSYYGMRIIHWSLERYKGTLPDHGLGPYLCYLFFLPILFAGPITGFPDFLRDLRRRRFDAALFSRGLERVVTGYAKIVIVGNYAISIKFAQYVRENHPPGTMLGEYLDCIRYAFNLYAQFSGYSDVAIGLGLMLGFRIAENFNWPFFAPNINEFWRRWHMTLTNWCRAYVFLPIAAATRRPALGTLAAMLVLGIWHELSLRFVVWGLYHGLGIVIWQRFRASRPQSTQPNARWSFARQAGATVITFNFVIVSFAIAKEETLADAMRVFRILFTGG